MTNRLLRSILRILTMNILRMVLYQHLKIQPTSGKMTYIFLDELHHIHDFPNVVTACVSKRSICMYRSRGAGEKRDSIYGISAKVIPASVKFRRRVLSPIRIQYTNCCIYGYKHSTRNGKHARYQTECLFATNC